MNRLIPSIITSILILTLSLITITTPQAIPKENITLLDTSTRMLLTNAQENATLTLPLTHYENITSILTPNTNLTIISTGHLEGKSQGLRRLAQSMNTTLNPEQPLILIPDYAISATQTIQGNMSRITLRVTSNQENDTTNHTILLTLNEKNLTVNLTTWEEKTIPIQLANHTRILTLTLLTQDGLSKNNAYSIIIPPLTTPRIYTTGDNPIANLARMLGTQTHLDTATAYAITTPLPEAEQKRIMQRVAQGAWLLLTPEAAVSWYLPIAQETRIGKGRGSTPRVIILIDISGSSLQPTGEENLTRLVQAKRVASSIITSLPEESIVSLIAFNTRANIITPPQPLQDQRLLIPALYSLPAYGGTSIATGLEAALSLAEGNTSIILLTDGYSSTPRQDLTLARQLRGTARLITIPLTNQPNTEHLARITREAQGILLPYTKSVYAARIASGIANVTDKRIIKAYPTPLLPHTPTGSVENLHAYTPTPWAEAPLITPSGLPVLITAPFGNGRISLLTTPADKPGSLTREDTWIISSLLTPPSTHCTLTWKETSILTCPATLPLPHGYVWVENTSTAWHAAYPAGTRITLPGTNQTLTIPYEKSLSYTQNTSHFKNLRVETPTSVKTTRTHPAWAYQAILILIILDLALRRHLKLHP